MKKANFKKYIRKQIAELAKWDEMTDMSDVSVSPVDKENGSPVYGDMIARNPKNHNDKWLVSKKYFEDNFEEINL